MVKKVGKEIPSSILQFVKSNDNSLFNSVEKKYEKELEDIRKLDTETITKTAEKLYVENKILEEFINVASDNYNDQQKEIELKDKKIKLLMMLLKNKEKQEEI